MPRALFLLDEKRVAQGKKEAMTLDQLVDDLGIEEALKAWDTASPSPDHKAVEAELRHLAAVLKAACRGLGPNEPAVIEVVHRLVSLVESEHGAAAAACLVPLSRACPAAAAEFMGPLRVLLKSGTQVTRRRAAIGFASVVKGLGLGAMHQYGVMDFLAGLLKAGTLSMCPAANNLTA